MQQQQIIVVHVRGEGVVQNSQQVLFRLQNFIPIFLVLSSWPKYLLWLGRIRRKIGTCCPYSRRIVLKDLILVPRPGYGRKERRSEYLLITGSNKLPLMRRYCSSTLVAK